MRLSADITTNLNITSYEEDVLKKLLDLPANSIQVLEQLDNTVVIDIRILKEKEKQTVSFLKEILGIKPVNLIDREVMAKSYANMSVFAIIDEGKIDVIIITQQVV